MATEGYIFDLKRYAVHDGPGIRTTVFMRGCPLNCWWCHNPESRQVNPSRTLEAHLSRCSRRAGRTALANHWVSAKQVMDEVARDIPYFEQSGGGVTFSGGEPLLQLDFLVEMLTAARERSIPTAVDTTGYARADKLIRIMRLVDLFLYDLKLMDDPSHCHYVGVSNRRILDNLVMLSEAGSRIWLRIPLIPGITDTNDNLEAIAEFVKPLAGVEEVCLLPYHRYFHHKITDPEHLERVAALKPQTPKEQAAIAQRMEKQGFKVRIGG